MRGRGSAQGPEIGASLWHSVQTQGTGEKSYGRPHLCGHHLLDIISASWWDAQIQYHCSIPLSQKFHRRPYPPCVLLFYWYERSISSRLIQPFRKLVSPELEIQSSRPVPSSIVSLLSLNPCRSVRHLSLQGIESTSMGRILYKIPLFDPTLELSGIPIDTCIKFVLQLPSVEEFYLRNPSAAYSLFADLAKNRWPNQGSALEHLQYLH